MLSSSTSWRLILVVAPFVLFPAALACSHGSPPQATASATITGPSVGAVKSAALIVSGAIEDSGAVGTLSTYVQFFNDPPGTACGSFDAAGTVVAGSLSVPGDPSTLHGRVLAFGVTPDLFFTVVAAPGSVDASTEDAADEDGGAPDEAPDSLVAVSGTTEMNVAGGELMGTVDAQMVRASDPGGPTVHVTGTFTAPACGE